MKPVECLVLSVLVLAGCGRRELSVPASVAFPPHFSALRDRIFRSRCANCHAEILKHTAVLREIVVPGEPTKSSLLREVQAGRMPKYGAKLSWEEVAAIETWITNGALND